MRFRRLRIAWSVAWGILALLLIVLWVRSQNWMDVLTGPVSRDRGLAIGTMPGRIAAAATNRTQGPNIFARWELRSETVEVLQDITRDQRASGVVRTHYTPDDFQKVWAIGPSSLVSTPIWWMVLLSATLAPVSLIRWSSRFTLRTLLVATTLVAVVLGIIVYKTRN